MEASAHTVSRLQPPEWLWELEGQARLCRMPAESLATGQCGWQGWGKALGTHGKAVYLHRTFLSSRTQLGRVGTWPALGVEAQVLAASFQRRVQLLGVLGGPGPQAPAAPAHIGWQGRGTGTQRQEPPGTGSLQGWSQEYWVWEIFFQSRALSWLSTRAWWASTWSARPLSVVQVRSCLPSSSCRSAGAPGSR